MQRGKLRVEILLQISFRVRCDFELCEVETKSSQPCDDDYHGGKQPGSTARYTFVSGLNRRSHGNSSLVPTGTGRSAGTNVKSFCATCFVGSGAGLGKAPSR